MEGPCGEHSGITRALEEHERRLNKYDETVVGIHGRFDDVNKHLLGMEKRFTVVLTESSATTKPRLDALEKSWRVACRVLLWTVIGLGSAISFFRQPIGKLLKWVFWG